MAGDYQLQAAGNAVNNDGLRNTQDQWNLASMTITVTSVAMMDSGVVTDSGTDAGVSPRNDGSARDAADATQDSLVDAGVTDDRPSPQSDASSTTADATREDVSSAADTRSVSDGGAPPPMSAGCSCSSVRSTTTGSTASDLSLLAAALGTALGRRRGDSRPLERARPS